VSTFEPTVLAEKAAALERHLVRVAERLPPPPLQVREEHLRARSRRGRRGAQSGQQREARKSVKVEA
jgi:hypothetical protein